MKQNWSSSVEQHYVGEITIQIKTAASGVINNPAQGFFKFIIMPVLDDDTLDPIEFAFPNY